MSPELERVRQEGAMTDELKQLLEPEFMHAGEKYSFEVDGKTYCAFDENLFAALLEAHQTARAKKASPAQEVRNG